MTDTGNYTDTQNLCYFPGDGWKIKGGSKFCGKPLPCPEHGGRKGFVMDGFLLGAWMRLVEKAQGDYFNPIDDLRAKEASLAEYRADAAEMVLLRAMLDQAAEDRDVARAEVRRLKDEKDLHRCWRDAIDL